MTENDLEANLQEWTIESHQQTKKKWLKDTDYTTMALRRKLCRDTENQGLYLRVISEEEKRKSEEQLTREMERKGKDTPLSL